MGFFDKLFGKKEEKKEIKKTIIKAAITGKVVDIKEVPDETFAKKLLGDGIAIIPEKSGNIVSPVKGTITQLFETLHAFTVETEDGVNILVHFGLNTVELKGNGFTKVASEGDKVEAGDVVIKYDLEYLKENVPSVITPIIVLDSEDYLNIETFIGKDVIEGRDTVLEITK
ncbi:PTS sugar transporter subunit IIA [Oceanivirga salmonicida]|uniref:PTS sugar transporter subunit IIA n=1 Tax=Oceanivirga salmonicida TaxID=1769291 RepID=UPI000833A749|nr:glucose PTS transporter subunit IIA [Oceanivirga salmonicida]